MELQSSAKMSPLAQYAALSSSKLARITRHKVIHCALLCQFGYWRHDTKSVCSKEHNYFWMSCNAWDYCAMDIVNRICHAGIFGKASIIKVWLPSTVIHYNIFHDRAKTDCTPNLGLAFPFKVDAFGIAAAFKVENATVRPSVLVIAYQPAV